MIFHSPWFLTLIPVLLFLWLHPSKKRGKKQVSIGYSSLDHFKALPSSWRIRLLPLLPWLQVFALILIILALARPQVGLKESWERKEGIDLILVLDVSTSMLAEDFEVRGGRRNRLEIVKEVTGNFIRNRRHDRLGIVIFGEKPYILSPLTWDKNFTTTRLAQVQAGMVEDGTAIGSALATAINRLRQSEAESKVVILLTDGVNNAGRIHPLTAAEAAQALGITIYTIGAGSKGPVPYPTTDLWGRKVYRNVRIDLDEALLQKIAELTGGRYFPATDTVSLRETFAQIDQMNKTEIQMRHYHEYKDLYPVLLICALTLLLLEEVFRRTVLRRLP
ncbi:MAG TPA: VWA domain-containing protein [Bacillota bacterium]